MQPASNKRWRVKEPIPPLEQAELKEFPPILRQLLYNRGFHEGDRARKFLEGRCPEACDPFIMQGMETAVARILSAVQAHEPMAVYGDYDVDGVTATVLLVQVLQTLGAVVHEYIPNRFDEGYGLNNEALDLLCKEGVRLVVTVDCGIRSKAEAEHARAIGLDLIITDHHHPLDGMPCALAVINPKQDGDPYPDKDLAGVGLAYKLAQGLLQRKPVDGIGADNWLDLVALGTVADLAPLRGENRFLVRAGLTRICSPHRAGLFSLANVSGLDIRKTTAGDIGFILGPRLNAAGRLESATAAFNLLMAKTIDEAAPLSLQLDDQNTERKRITRAIEIQIQEVLLEQQAEPMLIFAVDGTFNPGVVGLAASHLAESYHRPAIVGCQGDGTIRCSCRSIPEFNITEALDRCADLLVRHGGHAAAAGFTVAQDNLEPLKLRLEAIAVEQLSGRDLQPVLSVDMEVSLLDLKQELMDQIDRLQPFGLGNPEPIFAARHLRVRYRKAVGKESRHLKLSVTDNGVSFDAIAFGQGHRIDKLPDFIDLIFTFERNEYRDWSGFQLNVRDLKASGLPD